MQHLYTGQIEGQLSVYVNCKTHTYIGLESIEMNTSLGNPARWIELTVMQSKAEYWLYQISY